MINVFFLSSGFCVFEFWGKKLRSNRINLLSELYTELNIFFDYDIWSRKLKQSMQHLSLFSVCQHFFFVIIEDVISCLDAAHVFFGSRIRSKDFKKISYFLDIAIAESDFEENFCDMVTSTISIDISVQRPVYSSDSIEKDKQCDYYLKLYKPEELLVSFTSVLERMYVNYILNCLFELGLILNFSRRVLYFCF